MEKRFFNKICCLLLIALSFVFALTACTKTEFKLDFIVDGVVYETITTSGQETIQMPNDPEKEGYIFDGWYRDKDTWKTSFTADSLLDEQLSDNISVYAKWKSIVPSNDTQAVFDTFEKTGEYEYSLTVSNSTEALALEGVVSVNALSSWTLSSDEVGNQTIAEKVATLAVGDNTYYVLVTAEDHSTQAYTLKIRRKALFDVVFDVAGGTSVEMQQVEEGGLATAPETTKKGYDFVTWNYDFTTPITENKTIVATWEIKEYTITYDLAGGSVATDNPTAYNVESGEIVLVNPTLEGCTFLGWTGTDISAPTTKVTIVTGSTGNREYVANWDFEAFDITYHLNGGQNNSNNPATYNAYTSITLKSPTRAGYTFGGWYTSSDCSARSKINIIAKGSTGDLNLYAKWGTISFAAEEDVNKLISKFKEEGIENVSFLGDSITTFSGWSNNTSYNSTIGSNAIHYTSSKTESIKSANDTWWKQLLDMTNTNLCVNNAYSGDKVTGRAVSRSLQLHRDGDTVVNPDMIFVYLGVNDFNHSVSLQSFKTSYEQMISGMLNKYQGTKIYVGTIMPNARRVAPTVLDEFNAVIREIAEKYNVGLVDFYYDSGITADNMSTYYWETTASQRLHPNALGMDVMTQTVLNKLIEDYIG